VKKFILNDVIWLAIKNLKRLSEQNACKPSTIDAIFRNAEKELYALSASEKETDLRLFALAIYCYKTYNSNFFKTIAFARFGAALDYLHFRHTAKALIKEGNYALVVFWVVFRLSFVNTIPQDNYLPFEREMRDKSLEMGMNFYIQISDVF